MNLHKKTAIIATVTVLALSAGYWAIYKSHRQDTTPPQQSPTQAESSQNSTGTSTEPVTLPSKPDAGSSPSPTTTQKVGVTISHLSQDASTVYLRAFIEGGTTGTCTAKFEKSGYAAVTRTAPTAVSGETYVCQGFNVSKSSFPSKGSWSVRVSFSSNNKSGHSDAKNISIN